MKVQMYYYNRRIQYNMKESIILLRIIRTSIGNSTLIHRMCHWLFTMVRIGASGMPRSVSGRSDRTESGSDGSGGSI